jgi:hypothetical protein
MGFCRTNLFKRLESSGHSFLVSLDRHILRNYVFLHAIDNQLPLPIGPQDAEMLDPSYFDGDAEEATTNHVTQPELDEQENEVVAPTTTNFVERAAAVYQIYRDRYAKRFRWLSTHLFADALAKDLRADAVALERVRANLAGWDAAKDSKLAALVQLLRITHPNEKVLIFTQFADTVKYLAGQLATGGIVDVAGVTGQSADPTRLANRFSPTSNGNNKGRAPE